MKRITCEMCGSTDLVKKDGLFECQSCGTKYSVEEAKKMMIEGTVQVEGTIKVDNRDKIDNYLKMAKTAYESENLGEAEDYANKIIEIDPKHAEAWLLKGKAAGWQSTVVNVRLSESAECWSNAINYSIEERQQEIKTEVEEELLSLAKALIITRANNFKDHPGNRNYKELCDFDKIVKPFELLIIKADLVVSLTDFCEFMADKLNSAAVGGFNTATDYYGTRSGEMTNYKYDTYLEYMSNCISVLKIAALKARTEETLDLIYKNLEFIQNKYMNSKSYEFVATQYGSGYFPSQSLNKQTKQKIKEEIANYPSEKIDRLEKMKKTIQEERELYFENHPEEKEKLESSLANDKQEIEKIHKEINSCKKELASIKTKIAKELKPLIDKMNVLGEEIEELKEEKKNIGLLKSKERKKIKEKINEKEAEWEKISSEIVETRDSRRNDYNEEISSIEQQIEKNKNRISKLIDDIKIVSRKRFGNEVDTNEFEYIEEESFSCDRCGAGFVGDLSECPECGAIFD